MSRSLRTESDRRPLPRLALHLAVTGVVATLLAGCGGGGNTGGDPGTRRPVVNDDRSTPPSNDAGQDLTPTTPEPTPDEQPATLPSTLPAPETAGGDEVEPTTQPADPVGIVPAVTGEEAAPSVAEAVEADDAMPDEPPVDAGEVADAVDAAEAQAAVEEAEPRQNDLANLTRTSEADEVVAQILGQLAVGTLGQSNASPVLKQQAEALMTAAVRMAPRDSRLARELVDVRLATSPIDATIDALAHYRALEPEDRLAQLRYVDLSAEAIESADGRLSYLSRVSEAEQVPDEVRAHAAVKAAGLLVERLEAAAADEMIARAVELDSYNSEALRLDYDRLIRAGADRAERVRSLVRLLRANVNQPVALAVLAEELAASGLTDQAIVFYTASRIAFNNTGRNPPASLIAQHAQVLIATNRDNEANELLKSAREAGIDGGPTLYANYLASAANGAGDATGETVDLAAATAQRLRELAAALIGEEPPADAAGGPAPDVVALAAKAAEGTAAAKREALNQLAMRAFYDQFVLASPTDPALLDAIARVAPDGDPALARVRGWQAWREGNPDVARERLSSVADEDPLSKLGLLLLRRELGEDIGSDARAFLAESPTGYAQAALVARAGDDGYAAQPTEAAPAVRDVLATFPDRLLNLLGNERMLDFYSIEGNPISTRYVYGQPLLVDVTLRNSGRDTITLGPGGLLSPVIRVDAEITGLMQQQVPAAAYVEVAGRTRLEPGDRIRQTVRIDGPQLAALLDANPELSLTIRGLLSTNPITVPAPPAEEGGEPRIAYTVGPAGQQAPVRTEVTRRGLPVDLKDAGIRDAITRRLAAITRDDPAGRIRAARETAAQLRWLATFIRTLTERGATDADVAAWQELGRTMTAAIMNGAVSDEQAQERIRRSSSDDGSDAASAWIRYTAASVAQPQARPGLLRPLLESDQFNQRVVGVLGMSTLVGDRDVVLAAVAPLAESDPDPTVRRLARSVLRFVRSLPAKPAE